MKWLKLDSLRKRYAALTLLLAIFMLAFSWYAQNKVNHVKQNIEVNIESRNLLLQHNRQIRSAINRIHDLLLIIPDSPQKKWQSKTHI